jgi:hypothetical protein
MVKEFTGCDTRSHVVDPIRLRSFPAMEPWAKDVSENARALRTEPSNDRDPILQNIGGSVPTNTREGQLP